MTPEAKHSEVPHADTVAHPHLDSLELFHILRGQIEHEDNLITQRLSWFLTSQSFLFTAFAICLNNKELSEQSQRLIHLIPVLAISIGILIWIGIIAGTQAMRRLRNNYKHHIPTRSGLPSLQSPTRFRFAGMTAPIFIPVLFVLAWFVLLLRV